MSKSFSDLAVLVDAELITNISLGTSLAGTANPVSFPDDFEFATGEGDITISGGGVTIRVEESTPVTLSFGGSSGTYAQRVVNHANFSWTADTEAKGNIDISPEISESDELIWNISNDTAETVTFTIHSSADWVSYFGWDAVEVCDPNSLSITWT